MERQRDQGSMLIQSPWSDVVLIEQRHGGTETYMDDR